MEEDGEQKEGGAPDPQVAEPEVEQQQPMDQ